MYGKLIDGYILPAPNVLTIGDNQVWNAPAEVYLSQGWKPLEYTEQPEAPTGYHYESGWEEQDSAIVQTWTLVEDPDDIDEAEAWGIIFGGAE